jgi:hypothetical protein
MKRRCRENEGNMREKDKERGDRCTIAHIHTQADMLAYTHTPSPLQTHTNTLPHTHTHTHTHLVELKPHQGLNQRALPASLMTHYYNSRCIKWLVEILNIGRNKSTKIL